MVESPPKRITRARARAAEKEPDAKGTKSKKVATSTKATRTTKRKTRADDTEDQVITLEIPTTTLDKPEPAKATKGRPKKIAAATVETKEEEVIVAEPMPTQVIEPEPSKPTRGRPRKAVASKTKPEEEPGKLDVAKAKRAPRGRATTAAAATAGTAATAIVTIAAVSTTAPTKATTRSTAPKKKVTFQDDLDKENIIPPPDEFNKSASPKKLPEKATGLRAKPVRRPVAGRATRSSKKSQVTEAEKAEQKDELPPLSPKKAKQIPVAQPVSDEDELSGGMTPRRAFKKSLRTASTLGEAGENSVSKLDFTTSLVARRQENMSTADLLSPPKALGSSLLGTPARRPASPVKDMLKEPSPKKVFSEASVQQPFITSSTTTLKASLLQSPARRPVQSPVKNGIAYSSPKKFIPTALFGFGITEVSPDAAEMRASIFSPPKKISSQLRTIKSPELPIKVHKMSVEEQFEREDIVQKSPTPLLSAIELDPVRKRTPVKPIALKHSARPIKSSSPSKIPQASPKQHDFAMEIDSNQAFEPAVVEEAEHIERSTTPLGLPDQTHIEASHLETPTTTSQVNKNSDSEDELQFRPQDYSPTPLGSHRPPTKKFRSSLIPTPSTTLHKAKSIPARAEESAFTGMVPTPGSVGCVQPSQIFAMTPLVSQFGNLAVESLDKTPQEQVQLQRELLSSLSPKPSPSSVDQYTPPKSTFFDDEMLVLEQQSEEITEPAPTEISEASQEYGDENAIPIDPRLLAINESPPAACTPVKIFSGIPQVVHTVQRVPLKPAADDLPRSKLKRSASLSSPSSSRQAFLISASNKGDEALSFVRDGTTLNQQSNVLAQDFCTPTKSALSPQRTPGTVGWSNICSPARTPRRYVNPETLKGAVVYVDVHTAEGADASGIFVELLTQMGARCVKQWGWNPNSNAATSDVSGFGIGGSDEGIREVGPVGTPGATIPGSKVGITHVVFKDGGVRTLQKVRESRGVVLCVGVNWVLDCEREQKWLDETDYAVDISMTPRGGHRRRKSMEPRVLANINGNLVPCDSPAAREATMRVSLSPTKEFLTFSSPADRRESFRIQPQVPSTPLRTMDDGYGYGDGDDVTLSPTTPYFFRKEELVQRTCPPKQKGAVLFPLGVGEEVKGGVERERGDEGFRKRLLLARRKSLQWAPKVGSPLGRGVSFGG